MLLLRPKADQGYFMRRNLFVAAVGLGVFWGGCVPDIDTTQVTESSSSLGATVYREVCQREYYQGELADQAAGKRQTVDVSGTDYKAVCIQNASVPADAPAKIPTLAADRSLLVSTVDDVIPLSFHDQFESYLINLTPLADDGTMERALSAASNVCALAAGDDETNTAFERLGLRDGYRSISSQPGLAANLVTYDALPDFVSSSLALFADGGSAQEEWKALLRGLALELESTEKSALPNDPERTLKIVKDLLFSSNVGLKSGTSHLLTARDVRGIAQPVHLTAPFVDGDGDGLADVDAQGRFLTQGGGLAQVPTPFPLLGQTDSASRDSAGRALDAQGAPLYQTLDLDGTALGALLGEGVSLLKPSTDQLFGLLWGSSALLGSRRPVIKSYALSDGTKVGSVSYSGHDDSDAALLDLIHAGAQLTADSNLPDTLSGLKVIFRDHESAIAHLASSLLAANDFGKMHPEAQLTAKATLLDEMIPIIERILAVPGLAEDLLDAFDPTLHPETRAILPMIGRLMVARNQIDFAHDDKGQYRLTSTLDSVDPVDRTMSDVDYNRSLMQRIAHLIHDANGVSFCNKDNSQIGFGGLNLISEARCQLFQINDLALFYILNMASDSVRKADGVKQFASFCEQMTDKSLQSLLNNDFGSSLLQFQAGIDGFGCFPSPAALNRTLFLRPDEQSDFLKGVTEPIACSDGDLFTDVHDKSMFAWETTLFQNPAGAGHENDTFYDAIRPVIDAFAKHQECAQYDSNGACLRMQNAAKIALDLISKLHEHYTSPSGRYFGHTYQSIASNVPRYAKADNVVTYEALLDQVLEQTDLAYALPDTIHALNASLTETTKLPARASLIGTLRYLFNPDASTGLAYRNGATTTTWSDGTTPVTKLTPFYMLKDALQKKSDQFAANPTFKTAWDNSLSALSDNLLATESVPLGFEFKDRRLPGLAQVLLDFAAGRVQTHTQDGSLSSWSHHDLTQSATDFLVGPVGSALNDLAGKLSANQDARDKLGQLVAYLGDSQANPATFDAAVSTLGDVSQLMTDDQDLVPLAHLAGVVVDPDKGAVAPLVTLAKESNDHDAARTLYQVLRNLYAKNDQGVTHASDLSDIMSELNRAQPGQGGKYNAADYKNMFGELRDFLGDEKLGFLRFVEIVKNRAGDR